MLRGMTIGCALLCLFLAPLAAAADEAALELEAGQCAVDGEMVTPPAGSEEDGTGDLEVEKLELGHCGSWFHSGSCCSNGTVRWKRNCQVGPDQWSEFKCQNTCYL